MTLQAGTVLAFGIDSPLESYGLLQSYDISDMAKRVTAKGPDEAVTAIQEYRHEKMLQLKYLNLDSSSTGGPEIGTTFDFDGLPWQVDRIIDANMVDGFANVSLEARWFPGIH